MRKKSLVTSKEKKWKSGEAKKKGRRGLNKIGENLKIEARLQRPRYGKQIQWRE